MKREIVTKKDVQNSQNILKTLTSKDVKFDGIFIKTGVEVDESEILKDDYKTKLLKLIPAEIVGAYIAIDSIIKGNMATLETSNVYKIITWLVFGLLFILTPLYLKKLGNVSKASQLIFSTVAFAIWVMTLGGPFIFLLGNLTFTLGSIILILYTLLIPFFYK